jgi:hypothetical protein
MSFQFWKRETSAHKGSADGGGEVPYPMSVAARLHTFMSSSVGRVFRPWRVAPSHIYEEPIRAELFSIERLEQHAESLAAAQFVQRLREQDPRVVPALI